MNPNAAVNGAIQIDEVMERLSQVQEIVDTRIEKFDIAVQKHIESNGSGDLIRRKLRSKLRTFFFGNDLLV